MEISKKYPNIDMQLTGLLLEFYIRASGISVKEIQNYLHLSCPQPIYRWMKGKILPSVSHLLALSKLFGVHMENLLVERENYALYDKYNYNNGCLKRMLFYYIEYRINKTHSIRI